VGHIPEDGTAMGLLPALSVLHNAILREYRNPPIRRGWRLVKAAASEFAVRLVHQADVRLPHVGVSVMNLSGGNQQKLLTRREIEVASRVLVAVHPTRGLDIVATEDVRQALINYRNKGNGVLLISEDLDEILFLSDRIAVLYEGRIVGVVRCDKANREDLGLLMGGKTL
jgi:simple sugar transport system ATP-binding protein